MRAKEESTKIVNSITPGCRGSCVGAWPYSENPIFLPLFLSTLRHESDKLSL